VQAEQFVITHRAGCDLNPVDVTKAEDRLLLTSFVWPFRPRSSSAPQVSNSGCGEASGEHRQGCSKQLVARGACGRRDDLPVVWHSITQMYWRTEEVAAVENILTNFGAQQRLGEVSLEFDLDDPQGARPEVRTRLLGSGCQRLDSCAPAWHCALPRRPGHARLTWQNPVDP
jgi:hypothetical protein